MNLMNSFDCIIVGGGLAGSLLFHALKSKNKKAKVLLIEQGSFIGGNHTWCFHESDISWSQSSWVRELISKSWEGYDVCFPKLNRTIQTPYHCIRSEDLHQFFERNYSEEILLNMGVTDLNMNSVRLKNGQILKASCVVDARGWRAQTQALGYQKFVGLEVKLKKNHDQKRVLLKDARVEQIDGYRFIYILPWSEDELLIEDTYYSNTPGLKVEEIKKRILSYAQARGFEVEKILREESGCLPLVDSFRAPNDDHLRLGARSLEYQPVTGYSFPQTFMRIEALSELSNFKHDDWKECLDKCRQNDQGQRTYFHMLNKMLFVAARPNERYRVLERFYGLPLPLIERFYQGRLKLRDQARILWGKPPVSILRAIKSIWGFGA